MPVLVNVRKKVRVTIIAVSILIMTPKNKVTANPMTKLAPNRCANQNRIAHVIIVEKFPYSEIQDNTIGASLVPIDMLRLKLSFFGAVKFDPRSDKWLRINMYQGAPLPHEMKSSNDNWVYNSLN